MKKSFGHMLGLKLYLALSCFPFFRKNSICTSSPFGYGLLMPISCLLQRFSMWAREEAITFTKYPKMWSLDRF